MSSYYEKFLVTGEVKCIDEEILFEIPKNWCWVRLGDILTVKGGKRIPLGDTFAPTPTAHIYIRVTEMKNHTLVDTNLKYISDAVYEKIKNYTISKNDLYLTIAGTIGSVGVVPEKFDGMNLTENAVKLTNIFIDKWFLVYAISSQLVQTQFVDKTKQMAQPKLAIERIQTTIMPLPPYDEQKRIVAKVEELMPILEKYNKSQTNLDRLNNGICSLLSKSILQEAIQGKLVQQIAEEGTAQELIEQIRQEKQKLVKEGKLKKSALTDSVIFKGDDNKYYEQIGSEVVDITDDIPFEVPSNWIWIRLKDLCSIRTGATFKKEEASTENKGIRVLRGGNIQRFQLYTKPDDLFISEEKVKYDILLKQNDIITPAVTSLENIGKMARVEIDMPDTTVGGFVFIIRPFWKNDYVSKYLLAFMSSPTAVDYMQSITNKSGQAFYNIGKERLATTLVPLPPFAEQERICCRISELFAKIRG